MPEKTIVVAILQNQWFKDPDKVRAIYERHAGLPRRRAELNARFLFRQSMTGKRLLNAFGQPMCDRIIWEEASKHIGGRSSSAFPADPRHIFDVLTYFKPDVVLAFGRIACNGVLAALPLFGGQAGTSSFNVIGGPHPTARGGDVVSRLNEMAGAAALALGLLASGCGRGAE